MSPRAMRLGYLDSLKLFLTVLVIAHHAAITYGARGSWFYVEGPSSTAFRLAGTLFTTTNQFYFMGLFFFLSGYFVPSALARKGRGRFIRDRLVRLGIPLVLYTLLASPYVEHVSSLVHDPVPSEGYLDELASFFRERDFPPGPLWFVQALLVFSIAYALLSPRPAPDPPPRPQKVGHAGLFGVVALLVSLTFVVRLFVPAGEEWHHLQPAFFPQYVLLFVLGTMAERRRWLDALTPKLLWVWVPIMAAVVVAVVALMLVLLPRGREAIAPFAGGAHIEALALDVLENLYCVGASVTALVVFRARFPGDSPWAKALVPDAYAVYVLHAPVIVFLAVMARDVALGPWIKFALLTAVGTAVCFAASHFVVRPFAFARRVF
jgi:peptidoglycan/LPS O-acetylase OafA/YrhL